MVLLETLVAFWVLLRVGPVHKFAHISIFKQLIEGRLWHKESKILNPVANKERQVWIWKHIFNFQEYAMSVLLRIPTMIFSYLSVSLIIRQGKLHDLILKHKMKSCRNFKICNFNFFLSHLTQCNFSLNISIGYLSERDDDSYDISRSVTRIFQFESR